MRCASMPHCRELVQVLAQVANGIGQVLSGLLGDALLVVPPRLDRAELQVARDLCEQLDCLNVA
jgi:hypothetical protein